MNKSHHKLTEKIGESIWTSVNGRNWYNWEHRTWIPNALMQKMKAQQEPVITPINDYLKARNETTSGVGFPTCRPYLKGVFYVNFNDQHASVIAADHWK